MRNALDPPISSPPGLVRPTRFPMPTTPHPPSLTNQTRRPSPPPLPPFRPFLPTFPPLNHKNNPPQPRAQCLCPTTTTRIRVLDPPPIPAQTTPGPPTKRTRPGGTPSMRVRRPDQTTPSHSTKQPRGCQTNLRQPNKSRCTKRTRGASVRVFDAPGPPLDAPPPTDPPSCFQTNPTPRSRSTTPEQTPRKPCAGCPALVFLGRSRLRTSHQVQQTHENEAHGTQSPAQSGLRSISVGDFDAPVLLSTPHLPPPPGHGPPLFHPNPATLADPLHPPIFPPCTPLFSPCTPCFPPCTPRFSPTSPPDFPHYIPRVPPAPTLGTLCQPSKKPLHPTTLTP